MLSILKNIKKVASKIFVGITILLGALASPFIEAKDSPVMDSYYAEPKDQRHTLSLAKSPAKKVIGGQKQFPKQQNSNLSLLLSPDRYQRVTHNEEDKTINKIDSECNLNQVLAKRRLVYEITAAKTNGTSKFNHSKAPKFLTDGRLSDQYYLYQQKKLNPARTIAHANVAKEIQAFKATYVETASEYLNRKRFEKILAKIPETTSVKSSQGLPSRMKPVNLMMVAPLEKAIVEEKEAGNTEYAKFLERVNTEINSSIKISSSANNSAGLFTHMSSSNLLNDIVIKSTKQVASQFSDPTKYNLINP
jgi:hypothetical protein